MAVVATIVWTDNTNRLVMLQPDPPAPVDWVLERLNAEPDALGQPRWDRRELDWPIFKEICTSIYLK